MKRLLIQGHLGLGDHLLTNGLVRALVERGYGEIIIPCWPQNQMSLIAMFFDLTRIITTIPVPQGRWTLPESFGPYETLRLGYYYDANFDRNRWDEAFYQQAGVPFLDKWERFKIGSIIPHEQVPLMHTKFVHDDPARGFNIPIEGHRVLPAAATTIFDHHSALMQADEIHCISSCFAILADLINAPGKKFLHRYSRPDGGALPIFGREWTILDKPL